MKIKRRHYVLIGIVLSVILVRLFFSYSTPDFAPEAYTNLVIINDLQNGLNIMNLIDLNFYLNNVVFNSVLMIFSAFISEFHAARLIPTIFAASLAVIVYLIVGRSTKNYTGALLSAFVASFVPAFFVHTLQSISVYSIAVPCFFIVLYSISYVRKRKYEYLYIYSLLVLLLLHPSVVIFVLSLLVYIMITQIDKVRRAREEWEIFFFTIFVYGWFTFLIYKIELFQLGPLIVWHNIPQKVLGDYLVGFTFFDIIGSVGVLPFVASGFVIYKTLFREKNRCINMLIASTITIFGLLLFSLVQLEVGLMFIGVIFSILLGFFYKSFKEYYLKTKVANTYWIAKVFFISVVALSTLISGITAAMVYNDVDLSTEIRIVVDSLDQDMGGRIIISSPKTADLLTYRLGTKSILNQQYLQYSNSNLIYNDVYEIYTTPFIIDAIRLIKKYNVSYIFLGPTERTEFRVSDIKYNQVPCIIPIKTGKIMLYDTRQCLEDKN